MSDRQWTPGRALPGLVLSAAMVTAGCFHKKPEPVPPAPRSTTQEVIASPILGGQQQIPPGMERIPEAPEPYIDMVMVDAPVRLVLEQIARVAKMELIIPSSINKTISVQYVHVPASVALRDVLTRSGLRLGAATAAPLPFDTVIVYYRLPANVDSMSSDAIMTRFGVSRAIADLIVRSRRP
jgi:hypothetical protein